MDTDVLMSDSQAGIVTAFSTLFSNVGGTILIVFVAVSCLGTLNGLMLGTSRNMYSLAVRNHGPNQELFAVVDEKSNMPNNSAVIGLFISAAWLLYFYGANLSDNPWFGKYGFDSSELPIITTYLVYIPIFVMMIFKEKTLHPIKRFLAPILALIACGVMITAAIVSHGVAIWYYLIVFAAIMGIGALFIKPNKNALKSTKTEPTEPIAPTEETELTAQIEPTASTEQL